MKKIFFIIGFLSIFQLHFPAFAQPLNQKPELVVQTSHLMIVMAISFSSDGRILASGGWDNTIKLWNPDSGRLIRTLKGHSDHVNAVAFKPNENILASGGSDKTIKFWNIVSGNEVLKITGLNSGINSLVFSSDGKMLASGGEDGKIQLWDSTTGREIRSFAGHISQIRHLLFSKDSSFLISTSSNATVNDSTIKLWNLKDGTEKTLGHPEFVHSIILRADDKFLISVDTKSKITIWDLEKGTERNSFSLDSLSAGLFSSAFSSKGHFARSAIDGTITLLDLSNGKISRSVNENFSPDSLVFSPDGKKLAMSDLAATIKIWDIEKNKISIVGGKRTLALSWVRFSPDGKKLVTVSGVSKINLWNLGDSKNSNLLMSFPKISDSIDPVRELATFYAIFSPDGKLLATADMFRKTVDIWDAESGEKVKSLKGHDTDIKVISFSEDGSNILSGSEDNIFKIWDVKSGNLLKSSDGNDLRANDIPKLFPGFFEKESLKKNELKVGSLELSESDNYIAQLKGTGDGLLWKDRTTIYDRKTKKEICSLFVIDQYDWIVIAPDGRFDTNKNFMYMDALHWVLPDMPLDPVPLEVFMRDYYEPKLLRRLLKCNEAGNCDQEFRPVRDLSSLNRTQPKIEIENIKPTASPDIVEVTVKAQNITSEPQKGTDNTILNSGVFDLRLFREGQLVGNSTTDENVKKTLGSYKNFDEELNVWRTANRVDLKDGMKMFSFQVKLPNNAAGKPIEFSAYAFNDDRVKSETSRKVFTLPKDIQLKPKPRTAYVITFGVNKYDNSEWNLQFAGNDARAMREIVSAKLRSRKEFSEVIKISLVSDDEIIGGKTIRKRDAVKKNIKTVLDLLSGKQVSAENLMKLEEAVSAETLAKIKPTNPDDLILMSFSSHGYADRNGIFYILPTDIGKNSGRKVSDELLRNSISSDELSLWMRDVDAGEMVMIVDACHAASAVEGKDFKPAPMGSRGLGQLAFDKGMKILTATQTANVAIESGGKIGHGLLTYALLREGLEKSEADFKPRDKTINLKEWLEYGEFEVPKLYEKLLLREIKGIGRSSEIIELDSNGKNQTALQTPSLFDFTRKNQEMIMTQLP